MALTYDDAMTALRNADAAGDTGAAQQLAGIAAKLRDQRAAPAAPTPPPPAPEILGTPQGYAGRVAAIPTGNAPVAPTPQPAPPTFIQKARGAVEAALNTVDALVGGGVGAAGGFLGGVAGAVATGQFGTPEGVRGVEEAMAQGAQQGTEFLQGGPARAAPTPIGQEYTEKVGEALQQAVPVAAVAHALPPANLGPAARALGDVGRRAGTRVAESVVPNISPQRAANVQAGMEQGLTFAPHQLAESKFVKIAGESAEHVPASFGGMRRAERQEKFNRALIKHVNPESDAPRLTGEVLGEAMDRSGGKIGEITSGIDIPLEDVRGGFEAQRRALGRTSEDNRRVVGGYIDEFERLAAENNGTIPGAAFKDLNSELGRDIRANAGNPLGNKLSDLQDVVLDAFRGKLDPEARAAYDTSRMEYAKAKTLLPLVAKSVEGDISPGALLNAITATKAGKEAMGRGRGGELGDLARAGKYLVDQKSSGNAERSLVYKFILNPLKETLKVATMYPAAVAYNLAGPAISRAMVRKGRGAVEPTPAEAPPEPTLAQGFEPAPARASEPGPLGDLTPDWETAPGAAPAPGRIEVVPTEGLHRAVGEAPVTTGRERGGLQMPVVPGRPDLPDTMLVGAPKEAAASEASNVAMLTPGAVEARRTQATQRNAAAALSETPKPGQIPVGKATEITPQEVTPAGAPALDPRLAEIERLKAASDSDAVRAALDEQAKLVHKDIAAKDAAAKRAADVRALERAAKATDDAALRSALQARADKLRAEKIPVGEVTEGHPELPAAKTEKIPVGKVIEGQPALPVEKPGKIPAGEATEVPVESLEPAPEGAEPIPVGEATEVQPIPAGEATEMPADYAHTALFTAAEKRGIETRGRRPSEVRTAVENAVIKEHKLNPFEAERAKAVAKALDIDEKAVENAAVQHERSPRMFDKAIDRIIEQGTENAPETKQAAGSREGAAAKPETATAAERPSGAAPAAAEQPGANRPATPGAASEGDQPGGQGETRGVGTISQMVASRQVDTSPRGRMIAAVEAEGFMTKPVLYQGKPALRVVDPKIADSAVTITSKGELLVDNAKGDTRERVLAAAAKVPEPRGFEKGAQRSPQADHEAAKAEVARRRALGDVQKTQTVEEIQRGFEKGAQRPSPLQAKLQRAAEVSGRDVGELTKIYERYAADEGEAAAMARLDRTINAKPKGYVKKVADAAIEAISPEDLLHRLEQLSKRANRAGYQPLTEAEFASLKDTGLTTGTKWSTGKLTGDGFSKLHELKSEDTARGNAIANAEDLIQDNQPFKASAVDEYGLKVPEGYIREGEMYRPKKGT